MSCGEEVRGRGGDGRCSPSMRSPSAQTDAAPARLRPQLQQFSSFSPTITSTNQKQMDSVTDNTPYILGAVIAVGLSLILFAKMGCNNSVHAETKQAPKSAHDEQPKKEVNKFPNGPLSVFFGSQTGTAENFARTLVNEGKKQGFDAKLCDLSEFDDQALAETSLAVFLMATYGEGEPTDNAARFIKWLKDKEGDLPPSLLANLKFSVFGLGNRQYEKFNAMGHLVDERLAELGATRVYALGLGDDDGSMDDDFEKWKADLWTMLKLGLGQSDAQATTTVSDEPQKVALQFALRLLASKENAVRGAEITLHSVGSQHSTASQQSVVPSNRHLLSHRVPLTTVRELRRGGNGSTLHMEVDLSRASLTYKTADNLAVVPENFPEVVAKMAQRLGLDNLSQTVEFSAAEGESEKDFRAPYPSHISLRTLLSEYVDLQGVVRVSLLKALLAYTTAEAELAWLQRVTSKELYRTEVEDVRLNIVDILCEKLPSASLSLCELLHLLPAVQPRYYTISSSSLLSPAHCALTVGIIAEHIPHSEREFRGQCTGFLQRLGQAHSSGASPTLRVFVRESTFRLPSSLSVPVILVGPGTGIAPMRALALERRALRAQASDEEKASCGPFALFFGCKKAEEDYLYREELQSLCEDGSLSELHVAFSRDGAQKDYVQHHIVKPENASRIAQWLLQQRAHVYVCGATKMGSDVVDAFVTVLTQHGSLSSEEAYNYVKDMQKDGRYVQELWTA